MKKAVSLALALTLCCALAAPAQAYEMAKAGQRIVVSGGSYHTAAVDANGVLWTWGDNAEGQLGNGGEGNAIGSTFTSSFPIQTLPVKVLEDVASVSCGHLHTGAIKTDGSLWMWGYNLHGQLGNGTTEDSATPVKVMDGVAAVSCGDLHTGAIKTDGSLWMWGHNLYGQLSGRPSKGSPTPIKVMDNVAAVSCGNNYTAAIKTDGSLWMWGYNIYGELGKGTKTDYEAPAKVMDGVVAVCCIDRQTAAIKTDGSLWTWGWNNMGQLGNGSTEDATTPVKILDNVAAVSGYAAIKTDGSLWMWGHNKQGELGIGTTENSLVPVKVMDDVAFVSNGSCTAVIKTDGSLWAWGKNWYGELGNGGKGNAADGVGPIQTVPIPITLGGAPVASPTVPAQTTPIAPATPELSVTVNGSAVAWTDAKPFIDANSRTMVPLRAVGDALGLTVDWDGAKREAIFTDGTKTVYFPIDSASARTSDGQTIEMDTAAVIVNERTYAPVRYLAEYFGHSVGWDGATRTVSIQ